MGSHQHLLSCSCLPLHPHNKSHKFFLLTCELSKRVFCVSLLAFWPRVLLRIWNQTSSRSQWDWSNPHSLYPTGNLIFVHQHVSVCHCHETTDTCWHSPWQVATISPNTRSDSPFLLLSVTGRGVIQNLKNHIQIWILQIVEELVNYRITENKVWITYKNQRRKEQMAKLLKMNFQS